MLTDSPGSAPRPRRSLSGSQRTEKTGRAPRTPQTKLRLPWVRISVLSPSCQTSEWREGPQLSAPLRRLLRETEFPNVCRHYVISEEKGLMGQGPHFKFKPVVQLTTLGSDRTHPNFQWHCGLFILVTIARWPPPVTREEEAACVIGSQSTDFGSRSLTGESWGRICFEGLALPVYLPTAPSPSQPKQIEVASGQFPFSVPLSFTSPHWSPCELETLPHHPGPSPVLPSTHPPHLHSPSPLRL